MPQPLRDGVDQQVYLRLMDEAFLEQAKVKREWGEKKENAKPTDDFVALASTRLALNQVSSCRCVITNVGVDRNNAISLEKPGFTLAIVKPSVASTGLIRVQRITHTAHRGYSALLERFLPAIAAWTIDVAESIARETEDPTVGLFL